jgi:hypothetical protein
MKIKQIFLGLVITFTLNSCVDSIDGNGDVVSEKRTVSSFNKISISGTYEVFLNNGTQERVEIEADENLLELIETKVINNTLWITSTHPIGNSESLILYITAVNLKKIDASGAIKLSNKGSFTSENLEIEVNGAADIELDVELENLTLKMSGASETTLIGKVDNFDVALSGAGELDALKLKTRNTTITISGAGSATVFAKKTLDISISGAGSVNYKGAPKVTKSIRGAGAIEQL